MPIQSNRKSAVTRSATRRTYLTRRHPMARWPGCTFLPELSPAPTPSKRAPKGQSQLQKKRPKTRVRGTTRRAGQKKALHFQDDKV
jgi:hypothetical protein